MSEFAGVIICTRCDKARPRDQFRTRANGKLLNWCVPCKRDYDRVTIAAKRAAARKERERQMPALNFQQRFAPLVESGAKRQTIRAERKDGRMPATPGAPLKLYTGMRTKACRLLAEVQCLSVLPITMRCTSDGHLDVAVAHDGDTFKMADSEAMASKDGFADAAEMLAWFEKTHGLPFSGWLITWIPPTVEKAG
jgi:hypothetical protein